MIIMRMILPGFTVEEASTQEMLLSILLYGGNLWFLYVLFFIFLIFPLLDKVISSRGGHCSFIRFDNSRRHCSKSGVFPAVGSAVLFDSLYCGANLQAEQHI